MTSGSLPPPASPSLRLRVLLVDDHRLFLEGIKNLLAEGMDVVGMAHDGLEALAAARRTQPDVILMDINMPHCDGVVATRLIKAEMRECKIVMLTMSDDEGDLFEAVKSGASGYLLKRLDAAEFLGQSRRATGRPSALLGGPGGEDPAGVRPSLAAVQQPSSGRMAGERSSRTAVDSSASKEQEGSLSARQMQILTLVAQGQTYRQVAETIGIAERTVKYHMAEILEHLHLANRAQVIAYAARMGLARTGEGGESDRP